MMWGLASLEIRPSNELLRGVAQRAVAAAGSFNAQNVANLLWAYGKLQVPLLSVLPLPLPGLPTCLSFPEWDGWVDGGVFGVTQRVMEGFGVGRIVELGCGGQVEPEKEVFEAMSRHTV